LFILQNNILNINITKELELIEEILDLDLENEINIINCIVCKIVVNMNYVNLIQYMILGINNKLNLF
jgi:hypothetical protein